MIRASEFRSVTREEKAFVADESDDSFPLMARNLIEGDYPLYLNHGGKQYQVAKISASPQNVKRLLIVCTLSLKDGERIIHIADMEQYLKEVISWI